MSKSRWVLLRRVDRYDPEKMNAVVNEGFELLGRRPQGRVLIKPNVVFANKNYSQHAFTHPELVGVVADKVRSFPASPIFRSANPAAMPYPPGSTSKNRATTTWAGGTGFPSSTSTRTGTRR